MVAYFHGNPHDQNQCGRQLWAESLPVGAVSRRFHCDVHGAIPDGMPVWIDRLPRSLDGRAPARVVPLAWVVIFWQALVWGVVLGLIAGALVSSALSSSPPQATVTSALAAGLVDGGSIELTNLPADPRVRPISRGTDIVATIEAASLEFDVSPTTMLRRAFCESRYNADVVGRAQEVSIFQFLPSTWMAYAPRLGYSLREIGHIEAQARVAAYMESIGEGRQWSCR